MGRNDADEAWEKALRTAGLALEAIWREHGPHRQGGVQVSEVRFKLDADEDTSVLCVLKGEGEGGKLIAFVGGLDLKTTAIAAAKKLGRGVLRWREDRPWGT